MGVVLAIDPGRRHGKTIDRLVREFQGHEVVVAGSGDEALELFERRPPELMVFPLFISPGDESRMLGRLQALADAGDRHTLSIPLRAFLVWETQAASPAPVPPRWFYWFRPQMLDDAGSVQVQEFADGLRADIDRPRSVPAGGTGAPVESVADMVVADTSDTAAVRPGRPAVATGSADRGPVAIVDAVVDVVDTDGDAVQHAEGDERSSHAARQGLILTRPEYDVVDVGARPLLATVWRFARRLPRAVQVGTAAAAILLTLGMSGTVGDVLSPRRWLAAATGRSSAAAAPTGISGVQAVAAGNTSVERIEAPATRLSGILHVESEPAGAAVSVDGKSQGVTPLNVGDLDAGKHAVEVTMNGNSVHETVDVTPGKVATLRTSIYRGWLALFSPIEVTLAVDGKALTLDDQNRAMLPSGSHRLTIQNRALGYSATRIVEIKPGATTPLSLALPKSTLSLTTSSPADIWIDGEPAGAAPLVSMPIEIGTRQVTARSAERGERHLTITATTAPVTAAIDFTTPAP